MTKQYGLTPEEFEKLIEETARQLGESAGKAFSQPSLSEQMQDELEPLPGVKKWDGEDIGPVLKHGRE